MSYLVRSSLPPQRITLAATVTPFKRLAEPKEWGLGQVVGGWLLPFWFWLGIQALVPSRASSNVLILGVLPVDGKILALLPLVPIYGLLGIRVGRRSRDGSRNLLFRTLALVGYGLTSLAWCGRQDVDKICVGFTLILFLATVCIAYGLVRAIRIDRLPHFLSLLTFVLAGVGTLYLSNSIFSLGLRSPEASLKDPLLTITRAAGPLYGSSIGYFLLVPALAYLLGVVVRERRWRGARTSVAIALVAGILGTASRAGAISLVLFVLFSVARSYSPGAKLIASITLCASFAIAGTIVFNSASMDRFFYTESESRTGFYTQARAILADNSVAESLGGLGYGAVWPWYRLDYFRQERMSSESIETHEGYLAANTYLYHPHSVLVMLGIELGCVGLWYFVTLGYTLYRCVSLNSRDPLIILLGCGLAATSVALVSDLVLFYHAPIYLTWWIYMFAWLRLAGVQVDRAARRPLPAALLRT